MGEAGFVSARVDPAGCVVELSDGADHVIGWRWLREHDESEAGLDPVTGQRRLGIGAPDGGATRVSCNGSMMTVVWPDGRETEHRAATLETVLAERRRLPPAGPAPAVDDPLVQVWRAAPERIPAPLDHGSVVTDDDAFVELLNRFRRWGWVQLDGVPPGADAVSSVAARIGYIRQTIFGGVWELAAELTDHADTAYGATFLGPHTDGTYSHDGPGIQLFACQERDGTGGESILVDGFAAALDLADTDPDAARLLAALEVPCRYVEPGVSLRAARPVLRCDHSGHLVQVSINPYDREPFLLADPAEWGRFADAYDRFGELVSREERWLRVPLSAGEMLMFDNWRVLHGRGSFTGSRRFLGCYLNHEDLESAWRVRVL